VARVYLRQLLLVLSSRKNRDLDIFNVFVIIVSNGRYKTTTIFTVAARTRTCHNLRINRDVARPGVLQVGPSLVDGCPIAISHA